MAFRFTEQYDADIEQTMREHYESLSEKDRRRYAAVEAEKLGHGGDTYIAGVLGCTTDTIRRGREELAEIHESGEDPAGDRVRREGGGRKPRIEQEPEIEDHLLEMIEIRTAGDPDNDAVAYTEWTPTEMADQLKEKGLSMDPKTIAGFLDGLGITPRKMLKSLAGGDDPDRNTQLEHIARLRARFVRANQPIFSLDTKAQEKIGMLYRAGRVRIQQPLAVLDHDYPHWADGKLIPHGIYDLRNNHGHITIGVDHDTSEFVCDSFSHYWMKQGQRDYPHADKILWLCDAGGSNSYRHHIFKQDVGDLATNIGLPIRVAHYPSYCSKYNPIEHRFFCHVSRACAGKLFDTLDTVVRLIQRTRTRTGLTTTVNVLDSVYQTGRKIRETFADTVNIVRSRILPHWNYTLQPA